MVNFWINQSDIGKFGDALTFDGDNDGLAFSKIEYLDTPEAFSISFWFQRNSDINGTENATNHLVNNVMLAQSVLPIVP